jgi:hypothetical protein
MRLDIWCYTARTQVIRHVDCYYTALGHCLITYQSGGISMASGDIHCTNHSNQNNFGSIA